VDRCHGLDGCSQIMVELRRGFHDSGGILRMDVHNVGAVKVHNGGAVEVYNGGMVSLLAIAQGVDDLDMNFMFYIWWTAME